MHTQEKGIEKENFKLFNFRFFTVLFLFCAIGIVLGLTLFNYIIADYLVLIISGTVFLTVLLLFKKKGIIALICIVATCSFYYYTVFNLSQRVGDKTDNFYTLLEVKVEYVSADESVAHCSFFMGEASLDIKDDYKLIEGQVLLLENATVRHAKVVDDNGFFDTFALTQNKRYHIKCDSVYTQKSFAPSISQSIRSGVKYALKDLPKETGGVIIALLTGDKYGIDPNVYTDYKNAGIAHVLAVSGLHVVFMCSAVDFLLKKCKVKKKVRAFLSIPVLFIFSATCSFAPSVIRASFMTILYKTIPAVSKKRYDTLSVMSFSAIILLLFNPLNLINYGFLLSYASVFGIIAFASKIKKLLCRLPNFLSTSLSVSTAVTISTFPLTLLFFGSLSIVSAISNIIVLPVLSLFYGIIFGVGLLTAIFPFLGVLTYPLTVVISFINGVANVLGSLAFLQIKSTSPIWFTALYYLSIIGLSDYIFMKKEFKKIVWIILICTVLFWIVLG